MTKDLEHYLNYEEHFHGKGRKKERMERKQAILNDRSQYKKTDQDQKQKNTQEESCPVEGAIRGRVLGIYPEGIQVAVEDSILRCQIKGSLKQAKTLCKNLIAVGDFVFIEPKEKDTAQIVYVEPRRSILSRADNLLRRKEQLIAVNIDQVLITASIVFPIIKTPLLDRYIIAAKKGNMSPVIVINKIDLYPTLSEEEQLFIEEIERVYQGLSIPLFKVSTVSGEGIEPLKEYLIGKASVFSGQSGTGKSSLINAITGRSLKTGEGSTKTWKGSHTTTTTNLIPLEHGGFCIDTPGIRSFGLWDLTSNEIEGYFTEIAAIAQGCRFQGCHHVSEPDCAVLKALEEGELSDLRFTSYCQLKDSLNEKHRTR